jgi:hypothetical protein
MIQIDHVPLCLSPMVLGVGHMKIKKLSARGFEGVKGDS